jgi:hypothetical protein
MKKMTRLIVAVIAVVSLNDVNAAIDKDRLFNCSVTEIDAGFTKLGAKTVESTSLGSMQSGAIKLTTGLIDFYGPMKEISFYNSSTGMQVLTTDLNQLKEIVGSISVKEFAGDKQKFDLNVSLFHTTRGATKEGKTFFYLKDLPETCTLSCRFDKRQ